jgi:hypothetical protein
MSARPKSPTSKGPPPAPAKRASSDSMDNMKTNIYDSGQHPKANPEPKPGDSTPIKAISMKTPGVGTAALPKDDDIDTRPKRKVQLRAMSEIANSSRIQQDLGRLAPPRDPSAARVRKLQDYVLWGSVSVILASVIALIIWFVAR